MVETAEAGLIVRFCGEEYPVHEGDQVTVGREADVVVDSNPYLHRKFLTFVFRDGMGWIANTGGKMAATITDAEGKMQGWLTAGGSIPLVFPRTLVRFSAGPVTYELEVDLKDPPFMLVPDEVDGRGATTTHGQVVLTGDQKLLLVALAEQALLESGSPGTRVPSSKEAAARLGWTLTRFNRKLDNVCDKYSRAGVRGLKGSAVDLASSRRARLVEYAVSTRLVTDADLSLLEALPRLDR